jgi:hypothetical protein
MKKQILKGAWAAGLVGVLAVLSLPAEAQDISAKVPFSFVVAGKTLPPGAYRMSTQGNGALLVRGQDAGAFVMAGRSESSDAADPKLIFHKYGDQYILRQAWLGGGSGRLLPESRLERELLSAARTGGRLANAFERVVIQGF